jgi:hypothetical protein
LAICLTLLNKILGAEKVEGRAYNLLGDR